MMKPYAIVACAFALFGCRSEQRFEMPTGAMLPTIAANGHVLADTSAPATSGVRRWNLVVFRAPDTVRSYGQDPSSLPEYVMRVLGLPGDTVDFGGQTITIDGKELTHFGIPSTLAYTGLAPFPPAVRKLPAPTRIKLATDEFFIVGDHTRTAIDSRFLGPLPGRNIVGKVIRIE